MPIDHVVIAVTDLAEAGRMIDQRFGLASIEGGRHPGWGTANRVVPLGDAYLELIAVVDPVEASTSVFGRWIAGAEANRPVGWAVRTRDIATVARRLGLAVQAGSRATPMAPYCAGAAPAPSRLSPSRHCRSLSSGQRRHRILGLPASITPLEPCT